MGQAGARRLIKKSGQPAENTRRQDIVGVEKVHVVALRQLQRPVVRVGDPGVFLVRVTHLSPVAAHYLARVIRRPVVDNHDLDIVVILLKR